uniref:Exporters of the RND superfamily-like protein n=1 Tax=Lysobacter sp. ATCC 53042 TaxID=324869 RepID=F8TUA8_9GAMM|nr:exporters of the RND superfamily-like protein [Lysobacter sp. ATCC 53042]
MSAAHSLMHYFENVPDHVRKYKWLVWLTVIAATAFAIAGLGRVRFDMTIEGWFADNDPTIVAMDGFRSRFGSDDHLYIVYKPKDGDVFSHDSLAAVRKLREDLLQRSLDAPDGSPLKRIVKITTLANAPVLKVEEDALVSRNLVGAQVPSSPEELAEVASTALQQRSLPLQYFSKDHKYGGILVETNFGAIPVDFEARTAKPAEASATGAAGAETGVDNLSMSFDGKAVEERVRFKPTDLGDYLGFINEVKLSLNKPEFASRFDYYPVGNPASTEYNMQVLQEMGTLYLAMLVIMVAVLWFLFRSFSGVLWPSLVVILSAVWTIGFASWLGVTFTAFLILTVVMILVIGIADSIHILSGYEYFRNKGLEHKEAVRASFHSSANACFLTAITSMVAMLSVVFTPIVPIQVFGIATAVGIGLAFLFSIYVLPLMLDLWWVPRRAQPVAGLRGKLSAAVGKLVPNVAGFVQKMLKGVFPFVDKYKYAIAGLFTAAIVVCLYGMTQVRVDTDVKAQFPKRAQIRENIDVADANMMGSQTLEIYLDLGQEYALHDPFVQKRIDELQRTIERKYPKYVVRTLSLVDVTKKSYQTLNEDRPEMYAVPDTREALANTLFLFDNSNPDQRRKMVSDDYSESHITVYLRNGGSYEYTQIFKDIQHDIDLATADIKRVYPDTKASVTGLFTLMMQGADYLSWTSLNEFGTAILTVSVILLLIFGSLKAGLVSVVSNAVPVTLTFGLMGLLDVPLDFTTVLIAPIVLGIAVDDTIHFLSHYKHEVSRDGDIRRALIQTIEEAGQAVTFTSLILALGLSVLSFSSSVGNANVGIYGSLAVLVGLVCELLFLPALVLIFGLKFEKRGAAPAVAGDAATEAAH